MSYETLQEKVRQGPVRRELLMEVDDAVLEAVRDQNFEEAFLLRGLARDIQKELRRSSSPPQGQCLDAPV